MCSTSENLSLIWSIYNSIPPSLQTTLNCKNVSICYLAWFLYTSPGTQKRKILYKTNIQNNLETKLPRSFQPQGRNVPDGQDAGVMNRGNQFTIRTQAQLIDAITRLWGLTPPYPPPSFGQSSSALSTHTCSMVVTSDFIRTLLQPWKAEQLHNAIRKYSMNDSESEWVVS